LIQQKPAINFSSGRVSLIISPYCVLGGRYAGPSAFLGVRYFPKEHETRETVSSTVLDMIADNSVLWRIETWGDGKSWIALQRKARVVFGVEKVLEPSLKFAAVTISNGVSRALPSVEILP
tara:strand:- start:302 stop:664 length:363 start_codon:yes stop_codon:yes gene_type:complete